MIQHERIQRLNCRPLIKGDYVIYWMQASQRAECNHALEYAIIQANELNKPLIVFFGVTDTYPEANERHYEIRVPDNRCNAYTRTSGRDESQTTDCALHRTREHRKAGALNRVNR